MIHIFKTSVNSKKQIKKLKQYFDIMFPKAKCNFDLEDCDKILRIDGEENINLTVIKLLKIHNFNCEELE